MAGSRDSPRREQLPRQSGTSASHALSDTLQRVCLPAYRLQIVRLDQDRRDTLALPPGRPFFISLVLFPNLAVVLNLHGVRRRVTPPDLQHLAPEQEFIPRANSGRPGNPAPIHLGAVRAIKILDGRCSRDDRNSCVTP